MSLGLLRQPGGFEGFNALRSNGVRQAIAEVATPWSNSSSTSTTEDLLDLPDLAVMATTYAVRRSRFLMNSTEVGRSKPSAILKVPSPVTFTRRPLRQRRRSRRAATEDALREAEEVATAAKVGTAAKLHVDEEPGTRGHLLGGG
jgi:hypothetical protein